MPTAEHSPEGVLSTTAFGPDAIPVIQPAPSLATRVRRPVLGCPIDALSESEALDRIDAWAQDKESRAVYLCNVHSVVTASRLKHFSSVIERSDMATPDGMPIAWMMRRRGQPAQARISGPDLMMAYCERAESTGSSIFLLGSDDETLAALRGNLQRRFPRMRIAGAISPPFRPLTSEEDAAIVETINQSGASVLFVGLGCPKQECWIDQHLGQIHAVMIGVGAAFAFHAGTLRRAPLWMRNAGLEWAFRLLCEPRKLWRRYLVTNTLFVCGVLAEAMRRRRATG